MIKLIVLNKRKHGITQDEWTRMWRDHGQLLVSTPEFARHMRKYIQSRIIPMPKSIPIPTNAEIGGISELWFNSVEDLRKLCNEPCVREITMPHTIKFIDFENSPNFLC